jgi:hypothetical protein
MSWIGRPPVCRVLLLGAAALGSLLAPASAHAAAWVKSVEYVEVTLAGTVMSASTNLSKGQNTAACVPFAGMTVTGIDGNFHVGYTDIFFETGPTRVTAQRGNSAAGTTVTVGVFVVEFDPAHVNVQQGTFQIANNQTGPILSPINPVVLTKTALVFYHIHDGAVPYENFAVTGHFPANNQVAFQRSGVKRPVDGHFYVFEAINSEFSVQTASFGIPNNTFSNTATIAAVDPARTFVISSSRGLNNTDDPSEEHLAVWLSNPTTLTARRQWQNIPPPPDNTIEDIRVFVVSSSDVLVQRGTLTYVLGDMQEAATLTQPVNTSLSMVWNGTPMGPGAIESNSTGGGNGDVAFQKLTLTSPTSVQGDRGEGDGTWGDSLGLFEVVDFSVSSTAVTLASFAAEGRDAAVELSWETGSELTNLGFHLYRAPSADGPFERITTSLVPGLGSSPVGASYSYRDPGRVNGATYFYELEDVDSAGVTTRHGPVSATPRVGSPGTSPPGTAPTGPTPPSRITFGDPRSVSLRVTERDAGGATLVLETGGFFAEPREDGTVRLSVPGFQTLEEPGLPTLPVERSMLEAVVGRRVRIDSVRTSDVMAFSSLRPEDAGAPEMSVLRSGIVQAGRRRAARAPRGGAWPEAAARILSVAFQGETKKVQIELAPFRWDHDSAQLLLARRLVVRVVFSGRDEQESGEGAQGRRLPRRTGRPQGVVARFVTRQPGLHAVAFEQVFPPRHRRLSTSELSLARLGQAASFFVSPDPQRFAPGSTLYFLSAGPDANPFANEAVYELSLGQPGLLMSLVSAEPLGRSLDEASVERGFETNLSYNSGLTEAADPWLWDYLASGNRKGFSFTLAQVAPAGGTAQITVKLQGASDYPVARDHHVRALVNGTLVGETSWGGKRPQALAGDIPPGVLREGPNLLELESVDDTGAYSLVFLDRYDLRYPHALSAEAGALAARFERSGTAGVAGLGAGTIVLDTTTIPHQWLTGQVVSRAGVSWEVVAGHRYIAVSPEALAHPEVELASGSSLRSTGNQADYVVITPRAFLGEAEALVEHRRSQGLSAMAVAVEDIFDEFGYGESRPEAVHDFIAYAFHEWRAPSVRYVVLLGDGTYDPKSYAGYGSLNLVPTPIVPTTYLWTASDPRLAAVNGEDALPDVALGRLPVSSVDEAHALVQKVLAWERSGFTLDGDATLVADNPDAAGDFEANAEEIATTLLATRPVERIYLSRLGTTNARTAIAASFDRGGALMSYIGHGSIVLWASEQLLKPGNVDSFALQPRQPLVIAMNCLNGFFQLPAGSSLAEKLVKAEGKGAIAAFSSSGLSSNGAAHLYHRALLTQITGGNHSRLGDALLAAQAVYADSGASLELLSLYQLLGDPALRIQ